MPGSATETIADYITGASFSDLPDEVVRKAKFWLLDSLGCGFGGVQSVLGQTAVRALAEISSGNAGVLGCSEKVSVGTSAFLNAMLINALDYDDCSVAGHLSSTLVGTLLAMKEQTDVSGHHFLLSYVTGYEVGARVAKAGWPTAERFAEVWGLGTNQTFGAVAAAAKLRELNKLQTLNALGIAGAGAPVPSGQKWGWDNRPLTWIKDAVAMPAQTGVVSATLAEAGFLGCRDILDGPQGFWRMAASDRCDFDVLTRGLGSGYFIMDASIKTWSCCWFIHPTLDIVKSIVRDNGLTHQDIAQIDVWSLTDLSEMFTAIEPEELVDAQFSLPYCVAMVLLGIPTGPGWFNRDLFHDETVLSIGSRVKIHPDSTCDDIFHNEDRRISARVVITTNGGAGFDGSAPAPRGTPMLPVSEEEITEKYLAMAVPVIGGEKARALKDFVLALETYDSVAALSELTATH